VVDCCEKRRITWGGAGPAVLDKKRSLDRKGSIKFSEVQFDRAPSIKLGEPIGKAVRNPLDLIKSGEPLIVQEKRKAAVRALDGLEEAAARDESCIWHRVLVSLPFFLFCCTSFQGWGGMGGWEPCVPPGHSCPSCDVHKLNVRASGCARGSSRCSHFELSPAAPAGVTYGCLCLVAPVIPVKQVAVRQCSVIAALLMLFKPVHWGSWPLQC
jgi:hypothetical protein